VIGSPGASGKLNGLAWTGRAPSESDILWVYPPGSCAIGRYMDDFLARLGGCP
jgi:hypothetical protein